MSGDVPVKARRRPPQAPPSNNVTLTDDSPSLTDSRSVARDDRDVDSLITDLLAWRESRRRMRTPHDWPAEPCSGMCMCWGTAGGWWNGRQLWTWAEAERSRRAWPA